MLQIRRGDDLVRYQFDAGVIYVQNQWLVVPVPKEFNGVPYYGKPVLI